MAMLEHRLFSAELPSALCPRPDAEDFGRSPHARRRQSCGHSQRTGAGPGPGFRRDRGRPRLHVAAMRQRPTSCIGFGAALVALAAPMALAQALSPTTLFEGTTTTPAKSGAPQSVHVSVQAWRIAGQEQELPLRGFYLAHLLSGQIATTIDGRTSEHL